MRRWNGWGDEDTSLDLSPRAAWLLEELLGPGTPPRDATLDDVLRGIPAGRLPGRPGIVLDAETRLRHARGQSLPDWVALRSGHPGPVPDGVALPADADDVRRLIGFAATAGAVVVPYGGGTGVVGGLGPFDPTIPTLLVSLERMSGLRSLDRESGLATVGAGSTGPAVEGALAAQGLTLGHFPQSWELSTVGGWVATRSAGQQSIGYGRIEALFAGGRLVAPAGTLDLPPHPASAAGPDLRQLVLGSEGRLGILTDVTLRASPRPELEVALGAFLPGFETGMAVARELARAHLPLSMIRLSTPSETRTTLAMAADRSPVRLLERYLGARGLGSERCLLLVVLTGRRRSVEAGHREVRSIVRARGGIGAPSALGRRWLAERFRAPYLRNTLWEAGYAVDTIETATDWARLPALARSVAATLRGGLADEGERVHAFSHLSHVYPTGSSLYTTFIFRVAPDPELTLGRWSRLKAAVSRAIVEGGGTISHQHGVGADHAAYLASEKGALGMAALAAVAERFDPDGRMNPGRLLVDEHAARGPRRAAAGDRSTGP
jgi:alkyldihydroxyacetonephosphate synthase